MNTIEFADKGPSEIPDWAIRQRHLIDTMNQAAPIYQKDILMMMEHLSGEKIGLGWMDRMMDMKVTIIGHYSTLLEEVSKYTNKVDSCGIQ